MTTRNAGAAILASVSILFAAANAGAQAPSATGGQQSAEEIAAQLANPNNALGTLTLNVDAKWFGGSLAGANSPSGLSLQFQPSFPYPLGGGTNLFVRPAIPFVPSQPIPSAAGGFESAGTAIGDIGYDVAIGKSIEGGWVVVGGAFGSLPTATNDDLGLNRALLGPEFLVSKISRRGVVGILVNHAWNVTRRDEFQTSITGGQYFIVLNLGGGWQFRSDPLFSYDHGGAAGDRWSFPIAAGIGKTAILGRMPWKFAVSYWYYVAAPATFGTRHQLRFSVGPVVPLPW